MTAKQARRFDPLKWTLRKIRGDAGIFIYRAKRLIDGWAA